MADTIFRTLEISAIALHNSGTLLINESVIPASSPATSLLWMKIDLLDIDRLNPSINFVYALERLDGIIWKYICGGRWVGLTEEVIDPDLGPYSPQCSASIVTGEGVGGSRQNRSKRGWRVRGRIELPSSIQLGWRVQIIVPATE